jgi:hypothetical protein
LLVGIYQVFPVEGKEDVLFVDVDVTGGGIKEKVLLSGEGEFVADYGRWDGKPASLDQSIVVEVPASIMKTASSTDIFVVDPGKLTGFMEPTGAFTKEDIDRRSSKNVPPGTLIIVELDNAA